MSYAMNQSGRLISELVDDVLDPIASLLTADQRDDLETVLSPYIRTPVVDGGNNARTAAIENLVTVVRNIAIMDRAVQLRIDLYNRAQDSHDRFHGMARKRP